MEGHRLKTFEKRVLRRIFELKRDEMVGSWRKLHNEDHHNSYSSPSIIKMMHSRMGRAFSNYEKTTNAYWWESQKGNVSCMTFDQNQHLFIEHTDQPEGKKPLGRPRRKWADNTKLGPRERVVV
jgi:hypothetical protein